MRFLALFICVVMLGTPPAKAQEVPKIEVFPKTISKSCYGGRAESYDECGDQTQHLVDAQARASETGKSVLVVLGAEWCIWCHVFKNYLKGESGFFEYTLEGESGYRMNEFASADDEVQAAVLAEYAADNFVIVAIEDQYATGADVVLAATGADDEVINWIPFVYVLDAKGQIAGRLPTFQERPEMEHRREGVFWYRGYNRLVLLDALKDLRAKAARP